MLAEGRDSFCASCGARWLQQGGTRRSVRPGHARGRARDPDRLRVEEREPGVLHLIGEADMYNLDRLETGLEEHMRRDVDLILDLTELRFIDSAGLGVLTRLLARLEGSTPRVTGVSDRVRKLLTTVGVHYLPKAWEPAS